MQFDSSAAAWPLAARAERGERVRRIRVLMAALEDDPEYVADLAAFEEELGKLGWTDGRNIRIERRWAPELELMRRHAKELVGLEPDLIVSQNTPTTASLLQQTRTIPIIFTNVSDPVGSSFVASLPRPGGNVTGFINLEGSLGSKWLGLLKEIAPRVTRVALLIHPATATYAEYYLKPLQAAAASLAARYRLPSVYPYRFFAELGGLLSYGNDPLDNFRRAAVYVDRILKGAKPSELPVQTPVKFDMAINLKTARALGLEVPPTLLARADEVIE